jgi:hypothetical protein
MGASASKEPPRSVVAAPKGTGLPSVPAATSAGFADEVCALSGARGTVTLDLHGGLFSVIITAGASSLCARVVPSSGFAKRYGDTAALALPAFLTDNDSNGGTQPASYVAYMELTKLGAPHVLDVALPAETAHLEWFYNTSALTDPARLAALHAQYRVPPSEFRGVAAAMLCAVVRFSVDVGMLTPDDVLGLKASSGARGGSHDNAPLARYYASTFGFHGPPELRNPKWTSKTWVKMAARVGDVLQTCDGNALNGGASLHGGATPQWGASARHRAQPALVSPRLTRSSLPTRQTRAQRRRALQTACS